MTRPFGLPSFSKIKIKIKMNYDWLTEQEFHINVVKKIRQRMKQGKLPGKMLLMGRSEGNYDNKDLMVFSKRMGYVVGDADVSILCPSFNDVYKGIDIELKVNNGSLRIEQIDTLTMKKERYNHFVCCVSSPNRKSQNKAIEKILLILNYYFKGPLRNLKKYGKLTGTREAVFEQKKTPKEKKERT